MATTALLGCLDQIAAPPFSKTAPLASEATICHEIENEKCRRLAFTKCLASFLGCYVGRAQAGQDYLNDLLRSLGKGSKITIDAVTGPMFNLQNAFEGDLIQAQPTEPTQPSPLP